MKVFISADIEGITGISTWSEAADQPPFEARERMTKEVYAACKGAIEAGAREIVIKDAHGDGKNLLYDRLPRCAKVLSGWSNHPYNMVEGLDETFDAIIFIGYHSAGGSNTSPLAHTLSNRTIRQIWLNNERASEFTLYANVANMLGIPIVTVAGDGGLIRDVEKFDERIPTVATQEGFGGGVVSIHPEVVQERIKETVKSGIEQINDFNAMPLPSVFNMQIEFKKHWDAYKYSFYPGVKQIEECTISLTSNNYMDLLKLLLFI